MRGSWVWHGCWLSQQPCWGWVSRSDLGGQVGGGPVRIGEPLLVASARRVKALAQG